MQSLTSGECIEQQINYRKQQPLGDTALHLAVRWLYSDMNFNNLNSVCLISWDIVKFSWQKIPEQYRLKKFWIFLNIWKVSFLIKNFPLQERGQRASENFPRGWWTGGPPELWRADCAASSFSYGELKHGQRKIWTSNLVTIVSKFKRQTSGFKTYFVI